MYHAYAYTQVLHETRDLPETQAYLADLKNMRKVRRLPRVNFMVFSLTQLPARAGYHAGAHLTLNLLNLLH